MPSVSRSIDSFLMSEVSADVGMDENTRRVFETIRGALAADAVDPFDRDAFLMQRAVVELIHGGRPPEGVGEAIDELTAWTHLAYLYWSEGEHAVEISSEELSGLVGSARPAVRPSGRPDAYFATTPPRRIWGSPTDLGPEPLDGWFAARRGDRLMVAALFGGRPDRGGASVVAIEGPDPGDLVREDGSEVFSSTLTGGARAGLYSLTGMEELLALAWRVEHWRRGRH
jgi:hypothetical protein